MGAISISILWVKREIPYPMMPNDCLFGVYICILFGWISKQFFFNLLGSLYTTKDYLLRSGNINTRSHFMYVYSVYYSPYNPDPHKYSVDFTIDTSYQSVVPVHHSIQGQKVYSLYTYICG